MHSITATTSTSQSALSSTSPCDSWIQKRDACRSKRGERHEKCCITALKAKRCLSFEHCPVEARPYYGETNGGIKNICSAFDESSSCFGNPRIMSIDSAKATDERTRIFHYHEKARRKVGNNKQQLKECVELSERLHRCLQKREVQL
ncbi:hypothetical protein IV203_018099 [Nitzschia inconspicua]|uniref:Uncharacterized protein n=1 Tax=Nitzschia inconspicua TaxID=303405 RepID=A0A9K3M147_9STRA|nr:hypothetical protein IV203_018099 [Nitzschia inconspicua]